MSDSETLAGIGHNSGAPKSIAVNQLRSIVERIERLDEEKKELSSGIRDIYVEAKSNGFDAKVLRQLIAFRRKDANDVAEQETLLDTYKNAMGMG